MLPENLLPNADVYLQLIRFFLILGAGVVLTRVLIMPLARRAAGARGNKKAAHSFENISGMVSLFIVFTVALQAAQFGSLVTIIGAIAAAATVAVGFGMREQVGSLVGGIFIHLDNPFVKGDYVKVGEHEGVVQEIKLRATTLSGTSSEKVVVPNGMMTTVPVKNFTKGNRTKTSIQVKTAPEKAAEAEKLLLSIIQKRDEVWKKPEPKVLYRDFEDGKTVLEAQYWMTDSSDIKKAKSEVIKEFNQKAVKKGLLETKKD